MGLLARACDGCGAAGTLHVREIQDLQPWEPSRRRFREPYRMARCAECGVLLPVRRDDPVEG